MGDPLREINSRHNYFVPGARGGVKGKKEGEFLFVVLVEIEGIFREIKVTLGCSWCISMMIGRFYDKKKSTGHLKKTCETFPCFVFLRFSAHYSYLSFIFLVTRYLPMSSNLVHEFKGKTTAYRVWSKSTSNVSNRDKLEIFALHKQAISGDCEVTCPRNNITEKAKWNAWKNKQGLSRSVISHYLDALFGVTCCYRCPQSLHTN